MELATAPPWLPVAIASRVRVMVIVRVGIKIRGGPWLPVAIASRFGCWCRFRVSI